LIYGKDSAENMSEEKKSNETIEIEKPDSINC